MLFYEVLDNGLIGRFTNNEKLAKLMVANGEWSTYKSTEEEIVMQGDGSGYCLKSEYHLPLANVVETKLAELKSTRDELEVLDIETPYGVFDYDEKSRERINAAIIALEVSEGTTIEWTLADNTNVELSAIDLKNVIALVAQRSNILHTKYRECKDAIADISDKYTKGKIKYDTAVKRINEINIVL